MVKKIVAIYAECNIQFFPVDCNSVVSHFGFRIYSYGELRTRNKRLYELATAYSRDSFTFTNIIAYNEKQAARRIPFSLIHELGHYILEHKEESPENEDDADEFASHFLAPRILIHKYGYRTADQIHDAFGLSYAAANRALVSYRKWFREISYRIPRQPTEPELQLEGIFFPEAKMHIEQSEIEQAQISWKFQQARADAEVWRQMDCIDNWMMPSQLSWYG